MEEDKKTENVKQRANAKGVGRPVRESDYAIFIQWYAMPEYEKEEMGFKTAKDFAEHYKINPVTLSRWKHRSDFDSKVDQTRRNWLKDKTPNVLAALYKRILKYGISTDVELWLSYVEQWDRKQLTQTLLPKLQVDDIRALISALPEEEQKPFYELLTNIIAKAKRATGDFEDSGESADERPENDQGSVQEQTNNVSADAPAGSQVAESPAKDIR